MKALVLLAMLQVAPDSAFLPIGYVNFPPAPVTFAPAFAPTLDMAPLAEVLRELQIERDSLAAVRDSLAALRDERAAAAEQAGAAIVAGESWHSRWLWRAVMVGTFVWAVHQLKGPWSVTNIEGDETTIIIERTEHDSDGGYDPGHGRKGKGKGHKPGGGP